MSLSNLQLDKIKIIILFLSLLASGCKNVTQQTPGPDDSRQITSSTSITPGAGSTLFVADIPSSYTAAPNEVFLPASTPQPTSSLPNTAQGTVQPASSPVGSVEPEADWRDAPIIPEISQHVLDIYEAGQAQGRNPHNFSVIGDCQAIPYVFLGPFERGELEPDSSESYLWSVIAQYKGSFVRSGMAVRGGFTAASLLTSLQADPHYCLSGETPLTCEFRLQNPSVAFITLETWADPKTIDRYESYLRKILDYVIEKGTVPILLTKADVAEVGNGVHVINPAIVRVAREYDVPLINFWRAAQYLDNFGIDPDREGFHLSPDGYKLKNILALRTLYMVWKAIENHNTNASDVSDIETPAILPTSQLTPQNLPQLTIPDCEAGCIYFGTAVSRDGLVNARGVFAFNYLTRELTQVLGEGYDLQDVSEDGRRLLVNDTSNLYEVDLENGSTSLISASFYTMGKQGAYWNEDDTRVIYLDQNHPIQFETGEAISLIPSTRHDEIYFQGGSCILKANCQISGVYRLDSNQNITLLDSYSHLVFSPDGSLVAFLDPTAANKDNYFHIYYLLLEEVERGIASRRLFYFSPVSGFMVHPDVREYAFSPDSSDLFILYDVYSDYFVHSLRLQTYLLNIPSGRLFDYGEIESLGGSLNPQLVWAPQGKIVLLFLTDMTSDNHYSISVYQTNTETGEELIPYSQDIIISDEYLYISNIYWR